MELETLREKYPRFVYESFSWQVINGNLRISFAFSAKGGSASGGEVPPDMNFRPELTIINVDKAKVKNLGRGTIDTLVFNLGLIEAFSYWKATCSPEIAVKCGFLNNEQIRWWQNLLIKGMGQYFYENRIDFQAKDFVAIKTILSGPKKPHKNFTNVKNMRGLKNRFLVPLGGGKDSIVTLEILKKAGKETNCFSLNPNRAIKKVMKTAGCKDPVIVLRKIDPKLLELNRQGFLNGHTPFSALLAFLSVFAAVIFDYKYIAFSNERSANEGNVRYLGWEINHQYSKSFEFEQKFRKYCQKYLVRGAEYFSFLRPLYELQIAKMFSDYPKYFKSFLSCNQAIATKSGTKEPINKWCGQCAKCLSVFASLYPFVKKKELIEIFKRDLFLRTDLLQIMKELVGESDFKPFECVGTKKENIAAFYLSLKKARQAEEAPFLLAYFRNKISSRYFNLESESKEMLRSWDDENNLPADLTRLVKCDI
ncbi:MAG: hypothetical protein Q8N16_00460 [bacterium]|nr:hypothetical protein [bacterium]